MRAPTIPKDKPCSFINLLIIEIMWNEKLTFIVNNRSQ